MRVLYIEGVAIHGGPEPCVGVRKGVSEASVGVVRAGLLSPETCSSGRRHSQKKWKATSSAALCASRWGVPRGQRTWARTKLSMRENREVPWSPAGVDDASSWMVRGVGYRRLAGRGGNAMAVSPR